MVPFVIYALPKSRTLWLSRFLTYGDVECHHDRAVTMRGVDDVKSWLSQDRVGTVETGAAPWWRLVHTIRPDARIVTIRRPVAEVVESLMQTDMRGEPPLDVANVVRTMQRQDAYLDRIENEVATLRIEFATLRDVWACAALFEHCLPYEFDAPWHKMMAPIKVSGSVPTTMRYIASHRPQIDRTVASVGRFMRNVAWRRHSPAVDGLDGLTIAEEPFDAWLRDGQALFAEHCERVGEAPDNFLNKNIPLARDLWARGGLMIVTARCNGRMFGYLATIVGPSLELEGLTTAMQTTFFASNEMPGIGLRLERATLDALAARGVGEVMARAGTRGDGARFGALYRRFGFEPAGELYRRTLEHV